MFPLKSSSASCDHFPCILRFLVQAVVLVVAAAAAAAVHVLVPTSDVMRGFVLLTGEKAIFLSS